MLMLPNKWMHAAFGASHVSQANMTAVDSMFLTVNIDTGSLQKRPSPALHY